MQISRFRARPPAAFALALFGLLPLAWKASEAAPGHGAAHSALRAHSAPRPHGAPTAGPPTAVPLYTFTDIPDGLGPQSRLLQGSDGNFYGTTTGGGSFGFGAIYRLTPAGKLTVLASFPNTQGGSKHPSGPLVEGLNTDGTPNGAFYGLTDQGGDTGAGTVYLFAADGGSPTGFSITQLYSFTGGADGGRPLGALTVGRKADGTPDGYLYGTTSQGGTSADGTAGGGVVFRVPKDGFAEDVLHTFAAVDTSTGTAPINDGGAVPRAGLLQRKGATGWGSFIGTASSGGAGGAGTVFSLTPAGKFVTIHDFLTTADGLDGRSPQSGLVQGANGALYGTTFTGGGNGTGTGSGVGNGTGNGIGSGTVYRLVVDSNKSTGFNYSQVAALGPDTSNPNGELIEATDGKLYGTSTFGGATYDGSVFRIDADKASATGYSATAVQDFLNSKTQGGYLLAGVIQGADGDLYGATTVGGSASDGTLFRLNIVPRKAPAPTITAVTYHHYDLDGSTNVTVTGTGITHGATLTISDFFDGTTGTVIVDDAAHIHADLTKALPPGRHNITVANADGQSASATLIAYGKPHIDGAVTITHKDGTVAMLVSGINFPPNGYNGSDFGLLAGVFDPVSGQFLPAPVVSGRSTAPGAQAPQVPQQFTLNLGAIPSGPLLVGVLSADGQYSGVQPVGAQASRLKPRATAAGTQAIVYSKGRTQYQVFYPPTIIFTGDIIGDIIRYHLAIIKALLFQLFPTANACPSQLLAGSVSLVHDNPSSVFSTTGPTTVLAGLISQDGGGLISQDGGGLISQDGGGLISQDGGGLISQDGGGVVSNDGGSLIGNDGGSVISNDGGSVVSNDGGSLFSNSGGGVLYTHGSGASLKGSASGRVAPLASAAHPAVITGLLGAVGSGPGVSGQLRILTDSAQAKAVKSHAAATDMPGSFTLTHTDQGQEHGTGSTDGVVTGDDGAGHEIVLLRLTFTPGQPDTLAYVAPGVVVIPSDGTPAPRISNVAPTLTALTPNTALVGSPDLTLVVTGTLFTSGAVVNWNGKPLATTVVSGTQATAVVPAALLSAAGTAQVTLANPAPGGGESAALPFVVAAPPAPTLTALSPSTALAGSPDLTLFVTGTLFAPGAVVNWNGKPLTTTFVSGTQATAVVPAAFLSAAGTAQVTIADPAPGGQSAALPFVITAPPVPLHTFAAGLQMLSVTEDYAAVGLSAALTDSTHPMVVWNPATGVYDAHTDLHPGVGYWVRLSRATELLDTGALPLTTAPFPIPLKAGWNMIGDPFPSPVALSSLTVRDAAGTSGTFRQAVSGGVVSGTLYAYPAGSTQYQKVGQGGSLTPFDGEWVYAFRDCTLLVPAR